MKSNLSLEYVSAVGQVLGLLNMQIVETEVLSCIGSCDINPDFNLLSSSLCRMSL